MTLNNYYLNKKGLALVVIDVQDSLVKAMRPEVSEFVIRDIGILIHTAKTLEFPILYTEQYPRGLKRTIPFIRRALETLEPFEKITFSAVRDQGFMDGLSVLGLTQLIVTGMGSHVCVFQTVLDLLARGYLVHVPQDAVCSRTKQNWRTGLALMERAGAVMTSTETIVFQLFERAGTDAFKAIAPLIK
ncbi:MAG: isochorismatase family protein [Deltaproteobacteria bacterium]|nr:isochorismatase family protein [Deltaproteobacteria bacterium]